MIDFTFSDGRTITREHLDVLGRPASVFVYPRPYGPVLVLSLGGADLVVSSRGAAWFVGSAMFPTIVGQA